MSAVTFGCLRGEGRSSLHKLKCLSAQSAATGPQKNSGGEGGEKQQPPLCPFLATADPSWVCSGAGGGISAGEDKEARAMWSIMSEKL